MSPHLNFSETAFYRIHIFFLLLLCEAIIDSEELATQSELAKKCHQNLRKESKSQSGQTYSKYQDLSGQLSSSNYQPNKQRGGERNQKLVIFYEFRHWNFGRIGVDGV